MATQGAKSGHTVVAGWTVGDSGVQDGGAVIKGGNVASDSPVTKSMSLADIADDFGNSIGSKVISNHGNGAATTDRAGVINAAGGSGTDGTTEMGFSASATQWVMQGGNVTTTLAGSSNDTLIGGAADNNGANATRDNTNQLETARMIGNSGVIDVLKAPSTTMHGYRTKGGGAGSAQSFIRPSGAGDEASADSAANATRAIPGELTYMFGGKNPKLDDYKSKEAPEE